MSIERPEDGIVFLRLNDARRENRLTADLCAEWSRSLEQLSADGSVRTLVVCGLREVFCAGSGLEELKQIVAGELHVRDLSLMHRLLNFPVPTIAAMEGHAVGGGLMAAMLCDLVVAASERRYGLNFTDLGLTPGMGSTRLLAEIVGYHFAAEIMLTGRFFRGEELARRGLFNAAVPSSEVLQRATDLAREISGKPRHVLEMTKAAIVLARRTSLVEAIAQEHLMHQICRYRPETAALIDANYLSKEDR